ncbi:MAG: acyl-CoA dehydrogenase family protein [Acidimicrobiia bacterium]|nr:acyl-CoA dehydrogenase family protein [Acidimicrobiia bacterium]
MTMTAETSLTADERRVGELVDDLLTHFPPTETTPFEFLGQQYDRGLAWVHFDDGFGGLGLNPKMQKIVNERLQQANAPSPMYRNPIGYGMCGPTVAVWGSDEQKQRYLRPLFTGEEVWCQLFSEPGSGSDFAGLSSSGIRDGEEWICNGQKVWTTLAHLSRWGLLVVRTDPQAVKHAGLTAFVVDMHAPTVEIRPLRQMTGEAEFNEVFFSDTRIPDSERLGEPGDGWRVSLTTLMNERVSIGGTIPQKGSGPISSLVDQWVGLDEDRRDAATLDEVMQLWSRAEVLRLTNIRANQMRKMGDPGPEGSIGKMASADLNKDIYEKTVDLMGADGLLYGSYEMVAPETAMGANTLQQAFLRSRANSIEGGTTEVMKNILGERVLGLPGDVRVDREVPWADVPRN